MARDPIALGISIPNGRSMAVLDDFISRMGGQANRPRLWSVWSQWGNRGGQSSCEVGQGTCAFPTATLEALAARGITAVIWWEPIDPSNDHLGGQRYTRHKKTYLEHRNDAYIIAWAQAAKAFGQAHPDHKPIIRLAHEANGTWFPWTVGYWDNTSATFKRFWRYVHGKFASVGAVGATDHVKFMWSVTKKSCKGCNPYRKFDPGGAYYDYVGITAFNWGKQKRWQSMVSILRRPMEQLWQVTRKPVIVAELASHFLPLTRSKAAWIRNGYDNTYDEWPRIKAILYLDSNQPKQAGFQHPDWRLVKPNDGSALDAYRDVSAMPRFQGSL